MPLSLDIWSRNTLCKIGCQSKIGCRTNGLSDQWAVEPMGCRTNGLSNQWAVGIFGRNPNDYIKRLLGFNKLTLPPFDSNVSKGT